MKINNFRGDLTDISAKKEALVLSYGVLNQWMSFISVVWLRPPGVATDGYNRVCVESRMRCKVVRCDVVHVDALSNSRHLIQFLHILPNVIILPNGLLVALEVDNIHLQPLSSRRLPIHIQIGAAPW